MDTQLLNLCNNVHTNTSGRFECVQQKCQLSLFHLNPNHVVGYVEHSEPMYPARFDAFSIFPTLSAISFVGDGHRLRANCVPPNHRQMNGQVLHQLAGRASIEFGKIFKFQSLCHPARAHNSIVGVIDALETFPDG